MRKAQTILEQLFEQFVAPTLSMIAKEKWKHVTPIKDFAIVEVICRILEGLLTPDACPPGSEKEVYEAYFQFAAVWAFGGAFGADKANDYCKAFSDWWRAEWGKSSVKFPEEGTVFDYYIDFETKKPTHWRDASDEPVRHRPETEAKTDPRIHDSAARQHNRFHAYRSEIVGTPIIRLV